MTPIKNLIRKTLTRREPIKRQSLLSIIKAKGHKISDRAMRLILEDMVRHDGMLLASSPKGYKLCSSVKEYERHIAYLEAYAKSIHSRVKYMKINLKREMKYQIFES